MEKSTAATSPDGCGHSPIERPRVTSRLTSRLADQAPAAHNEYAVEYFLIGVALCRDRELIHAKPRGYACRYGSRGGKKRHADQKNNEAVAMKKRGSAAAGAALLASLLGLQPAWAQDSGSVTVDVRHCVDLKSAAERLACFGTEVDEAVKANGGAESDESSAVTEDHDADQAQSASDETSTRRERREQRRAEKRAADESAKTESAEGEYSGTITDIYERLPSSYVITLDNGQVWEQTFPKQYLLRPGVEVRIRPTNWGDSYRLSAVGSGNFIQVKRVR